MIDPRNTAESGSRDARSAYADGRFVSVSEARLSLLDLGFTRCDATCDVAHVWEGSFFRLEDHLRRFYRSCDLLRLNLPYDREAIRNILFACVRHSGLRHAYIEMVCTRGLLTPGSRDPRTATNKFFAYAIPFVWIQTLEQQESGSSLMISDTVRIPPQSVNPTVKNYHWGDMTKTLFDAYENDFDTVVLVDLYGNLSEGPGYNVFCVVDQHVLTPGDTVLEGITRQTVLELCCETGVPAAITRISPNQLRDANEVFLTSTAGGVMPVSRVDQHIIGNGKPGPITLRLRQLYWACHHDQRYSTPVQY